MVHPQPLPGAYRHPRPDGRVGQVVLTVLGVLLIAVCAPVVAVVVLLSVGPGPTGVALVAASLPVLPLVAVYLWLDRYEPEPRGLLLFTFAWGACVATAGALLLSLPPTLVVQAAGGDAEAFGAVVVAPVVEEALKGLGLLAVLLVGRRALDGLVDGFVYAGMVGIGFAFTENVLYLGTAYLDAGGEGLVGTFVLRGVVSPFAHPLFTAATGIGLVLASRRHGAARYALALAGYAVAVLLHALWNGMAVGGAAGFLGTFLVLWVPLFVALVVVALLARAREARLIRDNVAFYARHGWFSPGEVQVLSSLPARRRALASVPAGSVRRELRGYQHAVVRLAHLRQRMAAGTAPWDAAAREHELLSTIDRVRSRLPVTSGPSQQAGGPGSVRP